MKAFFLISCFVTTACSSVKTLTLSKDVFKSVPFSSQYSADGALIRNVDYPSVHALVSQLNSLYQINLQDRNEAHITVVTPPEFQASIAKFVSASEMLARYSPSIQSVPFDVVCVGSRKSSTAPNLVFFLVVKAPGLNAIRNDLAQEAASRARTRSVPFEFQPEAFWAHITIGFIKGDVFEFTKGPESCLPDVELIVR